MKILKQKLTMVPAAMAGAIFAVCLLAWTHTYDNATPPDTGESPRLGASRIRELKDALQERLNVTGYYPYTGTELSDACVGENRRILFHEPIAATPTVAANHFDIRTMDVNSIAELVVTDEGERELQITDKGNLHSSKNFTMLTGYLATIETIKAVDSTGLLLQNDGGDTVVTIGDDGKATLADSSQLVTSAAPTADADLANKKYVDDQVSAIQDPAYSGGQSHTFNGGLIIKMGAVSVTTAGATVTFGTAFPNAVISVNGVLHSSNLNKNGLVYDSSKTVLKLKHNVGVTTTMHWVAIGY